MWKYQQAVWVLEGYDKSERWRRIESLPEHHQTAIEKEARRLFDYRRQP